MGEQMARPTPGRRTSPKSIPYRPSQSATSGATGRQDGRLRMPRRNRDVGFPPAPRAGRARVCKYGPNPRAAGNERRRYGRSAQQRLLLGPHGALQGRNIAGAASIQGPVDSLGCYNYFRPDDAVVYPNPILNEKRLHATLGMYVRRRSPSAQQAANTLRDYRYSSPTISLPGAHWSRRIRTLPQFRPISHVC